MDTNLLKYQHLTATLSLVVGLVFMSCTCGYAQFEPAKQLLLMKKEKVKMRFQSGDIFSYSLKGSKTVVNTFINNLSDTAVVTGTDTILYHTIDRVYYDRSTFWSRSGEEIAAAGFILFAADQVNTTMVQGEEASMNTGVSIASFGLMGAGVAMMIFRKKSQKIHRDYRLMMVNQNSVLFRLRKPTGIYFIEQ